MFPAPMDHKGGGARALLFSHVDARSSTGATGCITCSLLAASGGHHGHILFVCQDKRSRVRIGCAVAPDPKSLPFITSTGCAFDRLPFQVCPPPPGLISCIRCLINLASLVYDPHYHFHGSPLPLNLEFAAAAPAPQLVIPSLGEKEKRVRDSSQEGSGSPKYLGNPKMSWGDSFLNHIASEDREPVKEQEAEIGKRWAAPPVQGRQKWGPSGVCLGTGAF